MIIVIQTEWNHLQTWFIRDVDHYFRCAALLGSDYVFSHSHISYFVKSSQEIHDFQIQKQQFNNHLSRPSCVQIGKYLKGQFTQITILSHVSLVASSHAASSCLICSGFQKSVRFLPQVESGDQWNFVCEIITFTATCLSRKSVPCYKVFTGLISSGRK